MPPKHLETRIDAGDAAVSHAPKSPTRRGISDAALRAAKPTSKPYKLFAGNGLYLEVKPNGAKHWRWKYRLLGKENRVALGSYPKLPLREAREAMEIGVVIKQERLWTNMLSSQPLCFNLFGDLKLNPDKGNRFFQQLFPDYVAEVGGIYFEHSPGRGDASFTADNTAFDVFVTCRTPEGRQGFIAIEVKYSEAMADPLATLRPRYDELSRTVGIYREPESALLRGNPLQQLWREHMLSRVMVGNGLYESGRFVLLYPKQNHHCESAAKLYQRELIGPEPAVSGFQAVTLEACLAAYSSIGDEETAQALHTRYMDFGKIDTVIFG